MPFPIAAITDEFSPTDLDAALAGMADVGMTGAELRIAFGRNMIELNDAEVDEVRRKVQAHGMSVVALGVMPYITASIVIQLGASLYPSWMALKKSS